jgi:hypothetical protein
MTTRYNPITRRFEPMYSPSRPKTKLPSKSIPTSTVGPLKEKAPSTKEPSKTTTSRVTPSRVTTKAPKKTTTPSAPPEVEKTAGITTQTMEVPIEYGPHEKYYYNPSTGAITQQKVSGQQYMTRSQAERARTENISKGLSPYTTSSGEPLTVEQHRKEYEDYLRQKADYEKYPYRMSLGGQEIKVSRGMAGKFGAVSLASAIDETSYKREVKDKDIPTQGVKVYRKGEEVGYWVGETPEKFEGWNVEYEYKPGKFQPTVVEERKPPKEYGSDFYGGISLAFDKSVDFVSKNVPKIKAAAVKAESKIWSASQKVYPVERMVKDMNKVITAIKPITDKTESVSRDIFARTKSSPDIMAAYQGAKLVVWDVPSQGANLLSNIIRPVSKEAYKGFSGAQGWATKMESKITGFKLYDTKKGEYVNLEPIKPYVKFPFQSVKWGEGILAGVSKWGYEKPKQVLGYAALGGGISALGGGVMAAAPKTAPWLKGLGYGALTLFGTATAYGASQMPTEQRPQYVGYQSGPLVAMMAGGYAQQRASLYEQTWSDMTRGTKYAGMPRTDALEWKWLREGKPVLIGQRLGKDIATREVFISKAIKTKGADYVKPFLQRSDELWKYIDMTKTSFFTQPSFKKAAGKTIIDYSVVERIKPLGEMAPVRMSEFFGQSREFVVGGSLITASVFRPEAKGFQMSVFEKGYDFKTLKGYTPKLTLTGFEKKPSDIDIYSVPKVDKPASKLYQLFGGKPLPKVIDIKDTGAMDKYRVGALDIARKMGGRIGGSTGLALQGDLGRPLRDIDVEFKMSLPKKDGTLPKKIITPYRIADKFLTGLEKKFGEKNWAVDLTSRHTKIVWAKDVGGYKSGETFIDIGKQRAGFREIKADFGLFKKKLKVMDVRDLLGDKRMIVKYVSEKDAAKGLKATKDILNIEKSLAKKYKYGILQYKAEPDRAVFQTKELGAQKWDKMMEMHRTGSMLYPNIMAVTPFYKMPTSYTLRTGSGERILSPEVQMRRGVVGGYADSRYKDFPKTLLAKKGSIRMKIDELNKWDPLRRLKIAGLDKEVRLVKELEGGYMAKLGFVELGIEPLMGKPIKIKGPGGKVTEARIPSIGNLKAFRKRFGEEGTKQLIDKIARRKGFKGTDKRMIAEVLEKPFRVPKPKYPKYDSYIAYPVIPPASYASYKKQEYTPYTPYKGYPKYTPYTSYPKYSPYTKYTPYTPYTPYKTYTPYTPYKTYTPYTPYKTYTPYTPYTPYKTPPTVKIRLPKLDKGVWRKNLISKEYKRKHKYQPSLVAGMERITAKKMPDIITGIGVRPVIR